MRTWPWKVPLVNMADAAVHGGLLLLLGLAQEFFVPCGLISCGRMGGEGQTK